MMLEHGITKHRDWLDQTHRIIETPYNRKNFVHEDTAIINVRKCGICHRTYRSKHALRSHMRLHRFQQRNVNGATSNANVEINTQGCKSKDNQTTLISKDIKKLAHTDKAATSNEDITDVENPVQSPSVSPEGKNTVGLGRIFLNNTGCLYNFSKKLKENVDSQDKSNGEGKTNTCFRCGVTFKQKNSLEHHTCIPDLDKTLKCIYCLEIFKTIYSLKLHLSLKHKEPHKDGKPYSCPRCLKQFSFKYSRDRHIRIIHKDLDPYSKCYSLPVLRKKPKVVDQPYVCPLCKRKFSFKSSRDRHVMGIHKDIVDPRQVVSMLGLRKTKFTDGQMYSCPHCERKFNTKFGVDSHISLVHKTLDQSRKFNMVTEVNRITGTSSGEKMKPIFTCKQCSLSFSQEYLLRKHVFKIHWKEDNELNKIKQTSEKKITLGSGINILKNIYEHQRFEKEESGASSSLKRENRIDSSNKYVDNTVSGMKRKYFVDYTHANVNSGRIVGNDRKKINKELLRRYCVAIDSFGPRQLDRSSNRMVYTCKICSTTYTMAVNLKRHVKQRAYDHGIYLKLRTTPYTEKHQPDSDETDIDPSNHQDDIFKHAPMPPKLKNRFSCDICLKKFTRRFNMLSHRQNHTKEEFKIAGAREDVYKSPCGGTIINIDDYFEPVINSETEVTSSTNIPQNMEHSLEKGKDRLPVYLDVAGDENIPDKAFSNYPAVTSRVSYTEVFAETASQQERDIVLENDHDNNVKDAQDRSEIADADCAKQTKGLSLTLTPPCKSKTIKQKVDLNSHTKPQTISSAYKETGNVHSENIGTISTDNIVQVQNEMTREMQRNKQHKNQIEFPVLCRNTLPEQLNITLMENQKESLALNAIMPSNRNIMPCELTIANGKTSNDLTEKEQESISKSLSANALFSDHDKKECTSCRILLADEQKVMHCQLCDKIFCISCSDIPKDIYNTLFGTDVECQSGVLWACCVCKHLFPKITVLLSQLGDFEQIIDNRLTDMERKLLIIGNIQSS